MVGLPFTYNRLYTLLIISFILIFIILINFRTNSISSSSPSIFNDHYGSTEKSLSDGCQWKFDHYSPSSWELYWYNNITLLQNSVCGTLQQEDQLNKSITTIELIIQSQKTLYNQSILSNKYDELFSKMYYRYECSKSFRSKLIVSQYIEPLIGLLRDPLTICSYGNLPPALHIGGDHAIQSKRFFLLGPSAPYQNFRTSTLSIAPWLLQKGSQKILFDIGTSFFNGNDDPVKVGATLGARWFYEYFRSLSLRFDRIIAFEPQTYVPDKYWTQIPADLIPSLTFINIGVSTTGKFNPWNILKTTAKISDYVVVKLDIDTPSLELELINQILNDTSISSLIDEMFFEMHVSINEMLVYWGNQPGTLKDSYVIFQKLREKGIRMHSWP